jgi:hypothetical protein
VQATGKPANHIPTTASCDICHTTRAWLPATFDHSGVTGSCGTCHNGTRATGKASSHFVTSKDCVECHGTSNWTPVRYTHASATYPNHGTRLTCRSCHTSNSQTISWRSAAYVPDCAACHAGNYKSDPHTKYGSVKYTVSELRDCAGACHIYTDSTLTTIRTRRTGQHRANSGGF